ncbi:methyl-accepting chemotaxis protein [Hwanghaeella sp.]|uniref:methyl-accepting chemotaxis protein n=1 Tax=Hwanghaeella sp. TaxID=2605943 RepID=UPI003CCBAE8E
MFKSLFGPGSSTSEAQLKLEALGRSQAIIEFEPDGTILTANGLFLGAMGYALEEIRRKHHSMFVAPDERESADYRKFWKDLAAGRFHSGEFKRLGKDGKEIWIYATYNPILNHTGKVVKVVKFASDITDQKRRSADLRGQIEAIGRSQAVIEFNLDGTIIKANDNFLNAMGYRLDEVQGKHHSIFVDPSERASPDYQSFWQSLAHGEFKAGEFKRFDKNGREIWIQASYNPIFDMNGRPYKVVKFATDVTEQKLRNADFSGQIEAIGKSQAVIEFNLDGTIIKANDNFLNAVGYRLDEIKGKHHSTFMPADEANGEAYRQFWARLNQGQFESGEYRRLGKGGKEIWIQASYNPIRDMSGKPYKVVKYASDITDAVLARKQAEYIKTMLEDTAAGAEQLSASVKEIAASMEKSRSVSSEAVTKVAEADKATQRLDGAAKSMGSIIEAITGITGQINLLSLNATIEAARAGEAGKGFAVVASEVKSLADQARKATEDVEAEISNMMGVATDVVGALDAIRNQIDSVQNYVGSTASAIEEQTAVASEMSANMQKAAREAARAQRV